MANVDDAAPPGTAGAHRDGLQVASAVEHGQARRFVPGGFSSLIRWYVSESIRANAGPGQPGDDVHARAREPHWRAERPTSQPVTVTGRPLA